ncbi:MAG: polyhydroxybutyrate depolymerase [Alphaproteobacteria bacterium]|nr:MAG: polyhydroxybutyrate depolymerase [Alphaproteobacteria bacterium]
MHALRLLILLALAALPLPAAACGETSECRVDGGAYLIALPEGPAKGAVIFLHGYGGTAKGLMRNRTLVKAVTERGYALIAPQGLPWRPGQKGGSWNMRLSPERRDDIAFLRAVAADAGTRFGLPHGGMLLSGFSAGGMMVWRVACNAPEAFPAYAPVSGLLWRPLPEKCAGPMRMLHVHGWSDPVVPIEGRSVAGGRITQGDLFRGLDILRAADGCARDDPDSYDRSGRYLIRRWTECAPGARLELAMHPGGHMIPKDWTTLALDWFEGLPPAPEVDLACSNKDGKDELAASC